MLPADTCRASGGRRVSVSPQSNGQPQEVVNTWLLSIKRPNTEGSATQERLL